MKLPCFALAAVLGGSQLGAAPNPAWISDLDRAAQFQLAHPSHARPESSNPRKWVLGAFYAGLAAYDRAGADGHRFRPALLALGEANGWELGPNAYDADDFCIGQTYLDLYDVYHEPKMIAAVKRRCDFLLTHSVEGSLAITGPGKKNHWSWCDALFMAPAGWVHLSQITGNPAYRDYGLAHWWKTSRYLEDPAGALFFRDSTYFPTAQKPDPVFWSRGNGWVLAGLARVLEHLAPDDPGRPALQAQFRRLAEAVAACQGADGGWTPRLVPGGAPGQPSEESGTAYFCYGFAWGVNHGLLPPGFAGRARAAFAFLRRCEQPSGEVTHVQPIGGAPAAVPPDSSAPYGAGGFLLAGSQMLSLP